MSAKKNSDQGLSECRPPAPAGHTDSTSHIVPVSAKNPDSGAELRLTESKETSHAAMRYKLGSCPSLEEDVRTGKVVIGRLRIYSRYMAGIAFVSSARFPCDVVVCTVDNRKSAQHGDIVAVELIDEEEWTAAAGIESSRDGAENAEDRAPAMANSGGADFLESPRADGPGAASRWVRDETKSGDARPEVRLAREIGAPATHDWNGLKPLGRVRATLERSCALNVVAHIVEGALGPTEQVIPSRFYHFKSSNPLLQRIAVYGRDIPQIMHPQVREGLFLLHLLTRPCGDFVWTGGKYLTGRIVRYLGGTDSVRANSMALCSAFNVSMMEFSEEANACIPNTFEVPDSAELKRMGRRDLREEFVCSIDPLTARDLDDALSITRVPSGYRVGVHIADVSYFVPVGSPLDEEARERSTSVYLVEQVIPMLPRKLSEEYCSLNTDTDKFAFSCIFQLDHHGKLQSEWFGKSVIRNRCRLTYEEAQSIIDGDTSVLDAEKFGTDTLQTEEWRARVVESITSLYELASKMRSSSIERGRLTIGNMKPRFNFEDIANPTFPFGFEISYQIESNWVVEEFMLLANRRTAEKVLEYLPDQALLRRHEPPKMERISELRKALEQVDLELHGMSCKALQELLNKAESRPEYNDLCCMLKYCLQRALYYVNGCEEKGTFRGHYALALPWYTHFTSPIRRYCDLIVHRQLLCALEVESIVKKQRNVNVNSIDVDDLVTRDCFYTLSDVESIAENANDKKLKARQVNDASLRFFFSQYLNTLNRIPLDNQKTFVPRVAGTVVRIVPRDPSFTVFVAEVALEVVVKLNDNKQRFECPKKSTEKNSVSGALKTAAARSDTNDVNNRKTKDMSHMKKNTNTVNVTANSDTVVEDCHKEDHRKNNNPQNVSEEEGKIELKWGSHPVSREEVTEKLQLFSQVTGVFVTARENGYLDISMIVDPPWERSTPRDGIPTVLPV